MVCRHPQPRRAAADAAGRLPEHQTAAGTPPTPPTGLQQARTPARQGAGSHQSVSAQICVLLVWSKACRHSLCRPRQQLLIKAKAGPWVNAVPSHLQAMGLADGYCTHLPNVPASIMLHQPQQRGAGGEACSCCTVLGCCCVGGGPLVWICHTRRLFYGTTLEQEALPCPTASPHRCCWGAGFLVLCSVQTPEEPVSQMLFDRCVGSSDRATTLLSLGSVTGQCNRCRSNSEVRSYLFKRQTILIIRYSRNSLW